MEKEKWEMTFLQYCDDFIKNHKYGFQYKKNKKLWEGKKRDLFDEWFNILLNRSEIGEIPTPVIKSLIKILGQNEVLRTFRGRKEKGLACWFKTQTNKQYRENQKTNLSKLKK